MSTDLSAFQCLQSLPECLKCKTPLPLISQFLLLSCEDIICSKCTNINKLQAFCEVHTQQSIGEVLDEVQSELAELRVLLGEEEITEGTREKVREAAERITGQIEQRKERMDKFRKKSLVFNSEQDDTSRLNALQSKFSQRDRPSKAKAKTESHALTRPRPTMIAVCPFCRRTEPSSECPTCGMLSSDSFNVCKICFRLNSDELLMCPGCKCKDGLIVWICRGCQTRNQNGIIACQQCNREDEFQVELFRRKSYVRR